MGPEPRDAAQRFWEKVDLEGPAHPTLGNCWVWVGQRDHRGYGRFRVGSMADGTRKKVFAHRFSYALLNPLSPDLLVLHHCDNPSCVRPDHLYAGDGFDNGRDMSVRGRACSGERRAAMQRGEKNPNYRHGRRVKST